MPNLEKLEIVLERIVFTPECKWVYQLRFKLDGREFAISKELPEAAAIDLNMASSQPSGNSGQFKWIPVTERLPKANETVIVGDYTDGFVCAVKHLGDGRWKSPDSVLCTEAFTHWMHLPEPPKGE